MNIVLGIIFLINLISMYFAEKNNFYLLGLTIVNGALLVLIIVTKKKYIHILVPLLNLAI